MPKAQATHSVVLIVMIGMFLLFGLIILSGIFPSIRDMIASSSCTSKQASYCSELLIEGKNPTWDIEGCENPTAKCEDILKQK